MTSSISQQPASAATAAARLVDQGAPPRWRIGFLELNGWGLYGSLIVAALTVGALSLLFASTPSFDPWCWLVWGREILHGGLHTAGGSSWKPLPVIFTTVFALFGKAQPNLWLVVARGGFVLAILMSGRLALRATLWMAPGVRDGRLNGLTPSERWAILGPAVLAALIAAFSVALTGGWLSNSALGYSEGLAVAFLLIAFECHVNGHHRQAFACGLVAALDRPEIWIIWAPYGLWLMWRDPGARGLVIVMALLTLALWFPPQKWGGGSFTSGLTRATHVRANSNALKSFPFAAEMQSAWAIEVFRIKVASIAMVLGGLGLLGYHHRTRNRPAARLALSPLQRRGLIVGVGLGLFGYAWWVVIALETQAGLSGNNRYLTLGDAAIDIAGAMAYGGLAILLAQLPTLWVPADRQRLAPAQRLILGTAVLAAFFVAFPNFIGRDYINLGSFHKSMRYQAGLRRDLASMIAANGGAVTLNRCGNGQITAEMFQVPMVAWYLNERIALIKAQPTRLQTTGPWPNIVLQDRDLGNAPLQPSFRQIDQWTRQGARYAVSANDRVRIFKDCTTEPNDPKASIAS